MTPVTLMDLCRAGKKRTIGWTWMIPILCMIIHQARHCRRELKNTFIPISQVCCTFFLCYCILIYNLGTPCDEHGTYLQPGTPPPLQPLPENLFDPFDDEVQFRLADFLFRKVEMSQGNIDELLELWALSQRDHDTFGPFSDHDELHSRIDTIKLGDAPWKCMGCEVPSDVPANAASWQREEYQIWYRDPDTVIGNMLANTDFAKEFDPAAYVHVDANGKRHWCDFMS